jgi:cobalt/nickel transport system ATP-binding protein
MENSSAFEINDVSYSYDGKLPSLDHASLNIQVGECVTILGSNGSGKSTLLKILDGLYYPTSGSVCAFGKSLTEQSLMDEEFNFSFRRRVGLVFQDSDVQLFSPSVWDEIAFAPLQLGLSTQEVSQRVEAAMLELRIEKLRDRAPHRLSGGEKKRVALASVLSLNPEVWLMDEPTAGLDPRSQSWLIDFILEQREKGKTVITATHDLSIVETIADKVYILDEEHRIVAQGLPTDILADDELLIRCNLIHEHRHRHGEAAQEHVHPHIHGHNSSLAHDHNP